MEDIYVDFVKYVEASFGTSNYQVHRPLPIGKGKKSD